MFFEFDTKEMLAVSLINGLKTSSIEIKNVVPEKLYINESVRKQMKGNWMLPEDLQARADSIIR